MKKEMYSVVTMMTNISATMAKFISIRLSLYAIQIVKCHKCNGMTKIAKNAFLSCSAMNFRTISYFLHSKCRNKNNKKRITNTFFRTSKRSNGNNNYNENINLKLVYCVRSVYCVFFDSIIGLFILKWMLWHLFFK